MNFNYELANWAAGVVQSLEGDKLPPVALRGALNTQFWNIGGDNAAIGTRPGLRVGVELVPTSGTPPVGHAHMSMYYYAVNDNTAHTPYMACIDNAGVLRYKEADDSWDQTALTPPATYPSPATCVPQEFASDIDSVVMNNRLFILAGQIRRSLLGKTYKPFGLNAPQATAIVTPTTGGVVVELPEDTYGIYVTAYESSTGAESNPTFIGELTTTVGDPLIEVTFPAASTLADKWRIYVQRLSTQAQAYLLTDVYRADGSVLTSEGNIPVGEVFGIVNVRAEVLGDLLTPLPGLTENTRIPDDAQYVTTFGRRLIAASRRKIYWSKFDQPDSFPPENFESVETGEGDAIVGLVPMSGEQLFVFTTSSVWVIEGNDPQYWTVKPLDTTIGCVNKKSIVRFDNSVGWWSAQYGPVVWRGGRVEKIGLELLGRLEQYTPFDFDSILGGWDPYYQHVVWAVDDGKKLLPFNYRLNTWAAEYWDPLPVSCMATGETSSRDQRLWVADVGARLSYFDHTIKTDGVQSGTLTGTYVALATSQLSITSSGFRQETIGANTSTLVGMMVTVVDAAGKAVGRRSIVTATDTVLLLDSYVNNLVIDDTYTFYIGAPLFQVSLPWMDGNAPFVRKRHDRLYVDVKSSSITVPLYLRVYVNNDAFNEVLTLSVLTTQVETATTDATWDVPVWLSEPFRKKRLSVLKNGHNCSIVFEQPAPEKTLISKLSLQGRALHDRHYE